MARTYYPCFVDDCADDGKHDRIETALLHGQAALLTKVGKLMAGQAEIDVITSDVRDLATQLSQDVAAIAAKIQAGGTADVNVTALQGTVADLQNAVAGATALAS